LVGRIATAGWIESGTTTSSIGFRLVFWQAVAIFSGIRGTLSDLLAISMEARLEGAGIPGTPFRPQL
jgi:hypothetical protein